MKSQAITLTRRWTRGDAAGPVDGSLARAVAPVVPGRRVVAQTLGELHPTSASPGARAPRAPGTPAAVVGRLGEGERGGAGDMLPLRSSLNGVHKVIDFFHLSYRVVSLAGLVHALSLQADTSLPAGRPLHSRQLLGQAHHLPLANHGTPQSGAHVHARADCVLGAEGQAALADGVVALPRELLGAQEGLARGVEEAFGCEGQTRRGFLKNKHR